MAEQAIDDGNSLTDTGRSRTRRMYRIGAVAVAVAVVASLAALRANSYRDADAVGVGTSPSEVPSSGAAYANTPTGQPPDPTTASTVQASAASPNAPAETDRSPATEPAPLAASAEEPGTTEPVAPSAVDETTTATLTVDSPNPAPGQVVTLHMHVHNRRADTYAYIMFSVTQVLSASLPVDCGSSAIASSDEDFSWPWAFRVGGPRLVVLKVESCSGSRTDFSQPVPIAVQDGTGPANGPQLPVITDLDKDSGGGLQVGATDPDGTASSFAVDWGDGSAPDTYTEPSTISETCNPDAEYPWGGIFRHRFLHQYANAGTYTVTFTAISYGCGKQDPQTATGTMQFNW